MGTEILRPQDCLIERMRVVGPQVLSRRRSYANPNPKNFRKQQQQDQNQKKKSSASESKPVKNNGNIVMGHVTILKRGESLDALKRNDHQTTTTTTTTSPTKKKDVDLIVVGTERLGPDPELVPRQIRITDLKLISSSPPRSDHVYAGSAFAMSPSPSSLPLPSFYKKKEAAVVVVDDSATKDLRRLLRLDA